MSTDESQTGSIVLPRFETFRDTESYYATLVDETMHWTGQLGRQV
jgi:antirestriction protein ArdC